MPRSLVILVSALIFVEGLAGNHLCVLSKRNLKFVVFFSMCFFHGWIVQMIIWGSFALVSSLTVGVPVLVFSVRK